MGQNGPAWAEMGKNLKKPKNIKNQFWPKIDNTGPNGDKRGQCGQKAAKIGQNWPSLKNPKQSKRPKIGK